MGDIEYYRLEPVRSSPGNYLVTAAVMNCGLCGIAIKNSGGPGWETICVKCAEVVSNGHAMGCIKWDGPDDKNGDQKASDT